MKRFRVPAILTLLGVPPCPHVVIMTLTPALVTARTRVRNNGVSVRISSKLICISFFRASPREFESFCLALLSDHVPLSFLFRVLIPGTATPCFAYSQNVTACRANSDRCMITSYGCDLLPPTTTSTTSTTTTSTTTTPYIDACLSSPCDPLTTCSPSVVSGEFSCSPCPAGFAGDPKDKCTGMDSSSLFRCQVW